jgi:hypothetical protein
VSVIELTLHDKRRTGIPADAALLIMDLGKVPDEKYPAAKTMVRYLAPNGAKHAFLRDNYRHVMSCFPMPFGGPGWTHLTNKEGAHFVIAKDSVTAFEELEGGDGFDVTFNIPTGPLEIPIKATIEEVRVLLGKRGEKTPTEEQAPEAETPARPKRRGPRAPKAT